MNIIFDNLTKARTSYSQVILLFVGYFKCVNSVKSTCSSKTYGAHSLLKPNVRNKDSQQTQNVSRGTAVEVHSLLPDHDQGLLNTK